MKTKKCSCDHCDKLIDYEDTKISPYDELYCEDCYEELESQGVFGKMD